MNQHKLLKILRKIREIFWVVSKDLGNESWFVAKDEGNEWIIRRGEVDGSPAVACVVKENESGGKNRAHAIALVPFMLSVLNDVFVLLGGHVECVECCGKPGYGNWLYCDGCDDPVCCGCFVQCYGCDEELCLDCAAAHPCGKPKNCRECGTQVIGMGQDCVCEDCKV